uniref:tenascin isoform X3 n=1 Tax=Solea senegalensis TaxID=28829 RepID=UPI001CD85C88|nr:tenascin isoform X3 [Solea senegalensis]XP_043908737.1 tenascin isoform X3 [Solea senegalensis]
MFPVTPSLLLLLLFLLPGPALLTSSTSQELQVRGHREPREARQDSVKLTVSEGCVTAAHSSDGAKEIDQVPGSPLVLTHKLKLVPSGSGMGSGSCGCEADFAALRERLEHLERELSNLREKCGGDGGSCTSKESKGPGCSIKMENAECLNECSDQGRCEDGKCVCFPGFSGLDCSDSNCPGNCHGNGRCTDGQCLCDPGFTGPECSEGTCPENCSDRGRCVEGKCVCDTGFTGDDCSENSCPGDCNNRGRCVYRKCVCDPGFTGPDCSEGTCPDNCSNRGRCVDGKCVCDTGFTSVDCSEIACPRNCNKRGRCVNGECVCNPGFSGLDCSKRACPLNCSNRGRCVNGKCVCGSAFAGADCSEIVCHGNCKNRGRCVNGQCMCNDGFTGEDCSQKACPKNCNARGRCVSGKCVCSIGFTGPDCSAKACPKNCNSRGRCIKGKCFCQHGFSGEDCSLCVEGMTGPNCDTVMSGVSQLRTQDITETSVTLLWTPPPVLYDTYHITFTSQKEQQVKGQVKGSESSFTQTGLAAGQEYSATISGEIDGRRGAQSSTEFITRPDPPTDIVFSDVTETSLTVSWTKPKRPVSGFKVTYTHREDGDPLSVSLDSEDTSLALSQLSPGSTYEVSVVSVLGADESDPVSEVVVTPPDPPTNLHAINISDTSALLLWRPALAAVDKYAIVYRSAPGSELRITVSGNAAEQQLSDLQDSTTYTVTITSQLGGAKSTAETTSFTTSRGSGSEDEDEGAGPRDLRATNVTPRSATLSWKPPSKPTGSFRLTYVTGGQEMKEVKLNSSVTEFTAGRLGPGSTYTVTLHTDGQTDVSTEFTTGSLRFPFPGDCSQQLLNGIATSGPVEIYPEGRQGAPLRVYCDMETDGGGWTVFQRRSDGSVDFFRGWRDYVRGFGDVGGEFWLGLDALHHLTSRTRMSLRVDLRDGGDATYAAYSTFEVDKDDYRLTVGGYRGTAGDSLSYHNNRIFSTNDRDPAALITRCAVSYRGGWWYDNCHEANLNGLYGVNTRHQGVIWTTWKGKDSSISFTEMKMRPTSFTRSPSD